MPKKKKFGGAAAAAATPVKKAAPRAAASSGGDHGGLGQFPAMIVGAVSCMLLAVFWFPAVPWSARTGSISIYPVGQRGEEGLVMPLGQIDTMDEIGRAFAANWSPETTVEGTGTHQSREKTNWKVYSSDGRRVDSMGALNDGEAVYVSEDIPGTHWVWQGESIGNKRTVQIGKHDPNTNGGGGSLDLEMTTLSFEPRVFYINNFITDEEADYLIEKNRDKLFQSKTGIGGNSAAKKPSKYRTSSTTWDNTKFGAMINRRAFDLVRVEYDVQLKDGVQVLRYEADELYSTHNDWFNRATPKADPSKGGVNRFATIFLYLSDVEEGGQTVFPYGKPYPPTDNETDISQLPTFKNLMEKEDFQKVCDSRLAVKPKKAGALLFYSQGPDGVCDPLALHGGCPVGEGGVKWAANVWVWNGPRHILESEFTAKQNKGTGKQQGKSSDQNYRLEWKNFLPKAIDVVWVKPDGGHKQMISVATGGSKAILPKVLHHKFRVLVDGKVHGDEYGFPPGKTSATFEVHP